MVARIALAAVALVIAAGMALQIHSHDLVNSAVAEINHEVTGVKDRPANRAATRDALDAADLRPGTGALFGAIGLEVRAGNLAGAERLAERATRREPDNFSTWLTLGVIRQARKESAGAKAAFARVRKLNPLYRTPQ